MKKKNLITEKKITYYVKCYFFEKKVTCVSLISNILHEKIWSNEKSDYVTLLILENWYLNLMNVLLKKSD